MEQTWSSRGNQGSCTGPVAWKRNHRKTQRTTAQRLWTEEVQDLQKTQKTLLNGVVEQRGAHHQSFTRASKCPQSDLQQLNNIW